MSKSVRTAREGSEPSPRMGNLFRSPGGGLRGGWLLAVSLLCYALVTIGLRLALAAGFGRLFDVWGVSPSTACLAPGWAQWVYRWHRSITAVVAALASVALSIGLRMLWQKSFTEGKGDASKQQPVDDNRRRDAINGVCGPVSKHNPNDNNSGGMTVGTRFSASADAQKGVPTEIDRRLSRFEAATYGALGLALSFAALILGLLPDSIRPEWPLTAPRFKLALPALAVVLLLTVFAEEFFTKRVLYDGVKSRWGGVWAVAVTCAAHFLVGSGWTANTVGIVNALLLSLLCCALYARCGLGAAVGVRFGWSLANALLFGFGGGEASVYRFYGVSEALLTGGDSGPACGLWATLLLALALLWIVRGSIKGIIKTVRRK